MRTITLPSGHTVEALEPENATVAIQKALLDEYFKTYKAGESNSDLSAAQLKLQLRELTFKYLIINWDLKLPDGRPRPIPSADPTSIDELTVGDSNYLRDAMKDDFEALLPDFSPDAVAEPDSPKAEATSESDES
jgi:hypothetical protein